jgi:predicted dehydrogenase
MIKVGIIGLGAIGQRLIKQFSEHTETEISAVCDVNEELASVTAKQLGDAVPYSSHTEMLEEAELDLVYVAVPPKYHHQIASDVIAKEIHILCEKPLANSADEAENMLNQAEKAGIIHAMNFPLNYSSGSKSFAKLISEGYIGKLRRLELVMRFPQWPRPWQQNDWVAGKEQGGFVLEVGIHFIQQIQSIFGPVSLADRVIQYPEDPAACENSILARLELEDGTPLLFDGLSGIAGKERIEFTAYGTDGSLSLVNWGLLKGAKAGEEMAPLAEDTKDDDSLVDNVINAINGKPANIIDFSAGYEAQLVLEQLRN